MIFLPLERGLTSIAGYCTCGEGGVNESTGLDWMFRKNQVSHL